MIKKILFACASLLSAVVEADTTMKLTAMNIDPESVTASGISSGAFMAVQLHVAHSNVVHGSTVFAGGPYYCAQDSLTIAEEQCMYNLMGGPNVTKLVSFTNTAYKNGYIDNPANLADDKIFIFSGRKDTVVDPNVVKATEEYFQNFVSKSNIASDYTLDAQHCIPTLNYGEPCAQLKSPYIGNCNYDGAGLSLKQMYGSSLTRGTEVSTNLRAFDQTEFFSGTSTSIGDIGYIYIPTACAAGNTCKLHLSFHGCSQDLGDIGNEYAAHSGYNPWAEANNIIVVYPYAVAYAKAGNYNACWDWWGYTDKNYAYQSGVQVAFAKAIIDRLMGN